MVDTEIMTKTSTDKSLLSRIHLLEFKYKIFQAFNNKAERMHDLSIKTRVILLYTTMHNSVCLITNY